MCKGTPIRILFFITFSQEAMETRKQKSDICKVMKKRNNQATYSQKNYKQKQKRGGDIPR